MPQPTRCAWAKSDIMIRYHDEEWGVPLHDDQKLFEFICLEGAQAGLSWETILNKRENYRKAFDNFQPELIAKYNQKKIGQLLADEGIVRNRLKIASFIQNAKAFLAVQKEFGSFDKYIWQFAPQKPGKAPRSIKDIVARTRRFRPHEQRAAKARLQLRRIDDLLRLHAGSRHRERPRGGLLPPQAAMRRRFPAATVSLLAITGLITGLQFVFPEILAALRRNPDALRAGEWWRMITPLFVHAGGWLGIVFNFTAIAFVGTIVERIYGGKLWLLFYFAGALTGEIGGYAWKPHGAGASVGGAGLLGALALWLLFRKAPLQPRIGGAILLLGAVVLTAFRDLHGPPILVGACIAALVLRRAKAGNATGQV